MRLIGHRTNPVDSAVRYRWNLSLQVVRPSNMDVLEQSPHIDRTADDRKQK